jgi:glycosyltransferase involved in cell wall biosynthesis
MSTKVLAGCSTPFGMGGLGGHLQFICKAMETAGVEAGVYCRGTPARQGFVDVPNPVWDKWLRYTPVRWLPSKQVYWNGMQFDKAVADVYPSCYSVYHSFPGFAEATFRKVKANGGVTVLEAATTHAEDVYLITEAEHKKRNIGGNPFSREWMERVMREYELADYITVASRLQAESFLRRGFDENRILYSPLGIDTARFSPAAEEGEAEKDGVFRIIQVGQISIRKGYHYLLDAVEKLGDPDIEVVLVGGIGWRSIAKSLEEYRSRGIRITCAPGDPLPALRRASLYVHSSVEDGFGLAPLEAMSAGLPAVVTDMTGMKDVIGNGRNGFIVPSRDTDALAECIALLKGNENLRRQMGQAARATALEYDTAQCTRRYAELLKPVWNVG